MSRRSRPWRSVEDAEEERAEEKEEDDDVSDDGADVANDDDGREERRTASNFRDGRVEPRLGSVSERVHRNNPKWECLSRQDHRDLRVLGTETTRI